MNLKSGDIAPNFKLLNQNNELVDLLDYKGKKVLLYFYPKANTPGCTTQSCEVRDARLDLKDLNVEVIGISPDSSDKQNLFDNKYTLGFNLLSDIDKEVAVKYGVWGEKKLYGKAYMGIIRSSFLIDENGKILESWYKISPKKTIPEAIKYLNKKV